MALFDSLLNLTPDQNQGLLAAAAQLLQAGGPSLRPTSFGQALGGGLQAFQQGISDAEQRRAQLQNQALNAKLLGLNIQDKESDIQNQAMTRDRARRLQEFYANRSQPTNPAMQVPTGQTADLAPTIANAAQLPQEQQQPFSLSRLFNDRIQESRDLRQRGFGQEADAAETAALKLQPEVKEWQKINQDGKILYAPYFKDGTVGSPVSYNVAEKLEKLNLGGTTQLVGEFSGNPVRSFTNTQSPDSRAVDQRVAERQAAGANLDNTQVENVAQLIASGRIAPLTSMALRSPFGAAVMSRVAEINPNFQGSDFASSSKAQRDFATGKQGNAVRSFNVSLSHLDTLGSLADALNNKDIKAINQVGNYVAEQTGNPAPTNFDAAKKIVADEIVKAIVGSGGGVHDREEAARVIASANSPAQLKGVINTYQELMRGQLGGLRQQYEVTTGRNDFDKFLSESAKKSSHAAPNPNSKTISLADIAATARASGKTTAEVTAAAKAKGYTISGE